MAAKVRLLDHNQGLDETPREYLRKSVVLALVRRAQADWIVRNVLAKRREPRAEPHAMLPIEPVVCRPYIPEKMPPLNVPGVWFEEPQSVTWKIQHRTAWQSYPQI